MSFMAIEPTPFGGGSLRQQRDYPRHGRRTLEIRTDISTPCRLIRSVAVARCGASPPLTSCVELSRSHGHRVASLRREETLDASNSVRTTRKSDSAAAFLDASQAAEVARMTATQ